jgi:OOP family OmpA-OmpF porin
MDARIRSVVAASALAAVWAPVPAQESGAYVGGALGQAKLKEWCTVGPADVLTACEDTDTAWKLFGGYRFNRYVGIEASYINWGETSGTVNAINVTAEQTSIGIAAVGSFDFTPQFGVFGKAGFARTEQEIRRATATSSSTIKLDETEFHYGLGARFSFTRNWVARAEWERTDELEADLISIGVEYRF